MASRVRNNFCRLQSVEMQYLNSQDLPAPWLGLGRKLYLIHKQHMLNNERTRFMLSVSRVRENGVSKRMALR